MVKHQLLVGHTIKIGEVTIRLENKSGQRISLVIDVPDHVKIEYPDRVKNQENRQKST